MATSCDACGAAMAPGQAFCRRCGVKLARPADPLIGRTLGQYRVEREIARGGMGVVYHAFDERLERSVALKLLRGELAEDPSFRARFVRESRAAAGLDHPNILPVFDAGEIDGALYIATRLVDGLDLRGLLDRVGTLETDRALSIVGQVAGALDYAHQRGIVHRDVKPANILLTGDRGALDHAYLIDFGITASTSADMRLTATGRFLGTPEYVAPEQINAQALDGRADQYALACVLYHCLTASAPFKAGATVDVLHAHLHEPPPQPSRSRSDVSPALDDAVARALSKNPARRFETCRAFIAAARLRPATPSPPPVLTRPASVTVARSPRPPRAQPTPVGPGAVPPSHRVARIAAGVALLAALAGGGVAAGALLGKKDPPHTDAATADPPSLATDHAPKRVTTAAARTTIRPATTTAAARSSRATTLDPAALSLTKHALADYTVDVPGTWSLTKRDEPQVASAPARRTRTESVDRALGASIVIDELEQFDVPPLKNRATLDSVYRRVKPNYRRVGFDEYRLNATTAYEWRFRYTSTSGREVRRVDVMFRLGARDFAVRSGGAYPYDSLAQLARQTARSIRLTAPSTPSPSTSSIPASGRYTGTGLQRSTNGSVTEKEFPISMTFAASGSTVDYPTLGCTATLVPDGFSAGARIYREQITSGSCDRDGHWAVTVLAGGALQAEWTLTRGKDTVSARLTP